MSGKTALRQVMRLYIQRLSRGNPLDRSTSSTTPRPPKTRSGPPFSLNAELKLHLKSVSKRLERRQD
jgi:hypothetical protein